MLDITRKASYQDASGYTWDYYGDDTDPGAYYIVPRPRLAPDAGGLPSFQIVRYANQDSPLGRAGHCQFNLELAVSADIQTAIAAAISQGPGSDDRNGRSPAQMPAPHFRPLQFDRGGEASFRLANSGQDFTVNASISQFGASVASFFLPLTAEQLDAIHASFQKPEDFGVVECSLSVAARLPDVDVLMTFNSGLAYLQQLRQSPEGDLIAPTTSPEFLLDSLASKPEINWAGADQPADLKQAVADWANATFGDQVAAAVQQARRLQGIQAGESLSLADVGSFSRTFTPGSVIRWSIATQDGLSFPTNLGAAAARLMNLPLSTEIPTGPPSQVMIVALDLPFRSDLARLASVPLINGKAVFVDHVNVTVRYPGLSQAAATQTFTESGSQTFLAAYDQTAGSRWSFDYEVVYAQPSVTVSGIASDIDQSAYTLGLEDAGVLTVVFDASEAFATETTKPKALEILFSYMAGGADASFIRTTLRIEETDNPQRASLTIMHQEPVTQTYNFQVTYVYGPGTVYQAPPLQQQAGRLQILPAAAAAHSTNLLVYFRTAVPPSTTSRVSARMWYQQTPTLPQGAGAGPIPLHGPTAPAVFNVAPDSDCVAGSVCLESFDGFINGDQPLVYSATLNTSAGQIQIDDQLIENDQPTVMISPVHRYFTLEIDPAAVDWNNVTCESVEVIVNAVVAQGQASIAPARQPRERAYIWMKGETGSKYITYPILDGNSVAYDWKVNYVTPGQPVSTLTGNNQSDAMLNAKLFVPAAPQ